jgi:hypothetical protein
MEGVYCVKNYIFLLCFIIYTFISYICLLKYCLAYSRLFFFKNLMIFFNITLLKQNFKRVQSNNEPKTAPIQSIFLIGIVLYSVSKLIHLLNKMQFGLIFLLYKQQMCNFLLTNQQLVKIIQFENLNIKKC